MSDTLVKVDGVSKKFCRDLKRSLWYGLRDFGNELRGHGHAGDGELREDEFWAVKEVSFELKRGECMGVIGRNGAGKTTLLRMLNGLIKPDRGRIEMRGRVEALIALGAGFNPVLTGRENIHVNASVLGLSTREIREKIDEIIAFSELGDFIDMPVQSYSSGMNVRLGFAIASVLEPDVLLLDEVLAVGDAAFRYKCYRRIDQLLEKSAVILVIHDMPHVARLCDRAMLLSRGQVAFIGAAPEGIEIYQRLLDDESPPEEGLTSLFPPVTELSVRGMPEQVNFNSPFPMELSLVADRAIGAVTLRCNVVNMSGAYVASCIVDSADHGVRVEPGRTNWRIEFASLPLKPGRYHVSLSLSRQDGALVAVWHKGQRVTVTGGRAGAVGDCQLDLRSWTALR